MTIAGAQYLSAEERDLVQDPDFWQTISQSLPFASQLVDVRFVVNTSLKLNDNDQQAFQAAKEELFAPAEFKQIVSDWQKKGSRSC